MERKITIDLAYGSIKLIQGGGEPKTIVTIEEGSHAN